MSDDGTIAVVRSFGGLLHVPSSVPGQALCGEPGESIERPATWAGMWCTDCTREAIRQGSSE